MSPTFFPKGYGRLPFSTRGYANAPYAMGFEDAYILHQATGSLGYTGKTLDFLLVRAGGLRLYSRD
ncbi:hypothetical protein ACWATR_16795 [Nostoc sp. UIC 10890]